MTIVDWVVINWGLILNIVTYVIAISSIIVKWTPTQKDDEILGKIINILKVLSLNKKK